MAESSRFRSPRTDDTDCDVCLMVDQYAKDGGRHALMRMSADEAVTLGNALVAAGTAGPA